MLTRGSTRLILVLVIPVLIVLMVTGCASIFGKREQTESVLRIHLGHEPESLDPAFLTWIDSYRVLNNVNQGLVRFKVGTFDIEPDLAKSWEVAKDGKEWTFHLREGVRWHGDFGEFTAQDVKFSVERVLDPETASRWKKYWELIENVEVLDDYTVRFTLKEQTPVFLTWMAGYRPAGLVSEKAVEEYGEDYSQHPVGTGPFMFESWTPGEEVVLVANPDYREGPPELDRVIFKIIPEESVAAMAMEKGELDIMELTLSNTLERFRANEDLVVKETPATSIGYLNMKTATEPFSDVRVRRAVAHALDKQEIVRAVSGDMRKVVNSPIPEGMFGHTDDVHTYDYDPERAAALLTEAGYPDGFETSAFITDSDVYRQLYTAIQAYLAEVGIDMELETMDSATWVERTTAGEAPIAPLGLSARPDPDAILSGFFHGSVSSPQGRNFTWWDGADDLIDQARREMDTERRRELYIEIQQLMTKQLPTIPMSQGVNILAYQEGVKGHTPGKVGDNWLYETRIEPD